MKKLLFLSLMAIAIQSQAQNVGIGTPTPSSKLHVEAGAHNGILSISTILNRDSAAVYGILNLPTTANYWQSAIKGESKSVTDASIGVFGTHNGGGWGIAGDVKEGGTSGWGSGVYGIAGLKGVNTGTGGYGIYGANANLDGIAGYFYDYNGSLGARALKTNGKLQFTNIGEATGKILVSDANGNANWKNSTKYTSITPPNCQKLTTATDTYAKIANLGTFTKDELATKVELIFQTHLRIASISGVNGATYELRIDNLPTTNGNARASLQIIGQNSNASIFGLFTGLSVGTHTVSIWARSGSEGNIGGTATDVFYDAGCWSATNLTVKETF